MVGGGRDLLARQATMNEVQELVKLAERQGWRVPLNGAGHLQFTSPSGDVVQVLSAGAYGPLVHKAKSKLRTAGLDVALASPKKKEHDMGTSKVSVIPVRDGGEFLGEVALLGEFSRRAR
jgi:hypothetical protein